MKTKVVRPLLLMTVMLTLLVGGCHRHYHPRYSSYRCSTHRGGHHVKYRSSHHHRGAHATAATLHAAAHIIHILAH